MHFKAQNTAHYQNKTATPTNAQATSKRDKSQPKFNRKQDLKHPERRKPETGGQMAARICYISPGKGTITTPFAISSMLSPTFEQIAHKFAVNDSSIFHSSASNQQQTSRRSMGTLSNVFTEQSEGVQDERDQQIVLCHLQIQKMREEIEQSRLANRELKRKVKHFEGIQEFLEEREGFIGELMRKEAAATQRLQASEITVKEMQQHIFALRKEKEQGKEAYLMAEREYGNKIQTQKAEIEWILRLNIKLQQEIKHLKNPPFDNVFARKSKENAENSIRINPKRVNKSKSVTFMQSFPSNIPKDQFNEDLWKELIPTNDTTEFSSISPVEMQQMSMQMEDDQNWELEGVDARKTVKKLRQKMKYYEIEIDILKRLKLDCTKAKEDNEKLKRQNRKLLQRVEYLTQNYNRRGNNSDSSLQLSLSPKKA